MNIKELDILKELSEQTHFGDLPFLYYADLISKLLTAYEEEKEKNSNSIEKILADDFKRHIDSITIGKSITFPCGWIYKKDLLNLIDNIKWKR